MTYLEEMLDLFSGQLSIGDMKELSFGELKLLSDARKQRIRMQNNSKETRQMQKTMQRISRRTP